MTASKRIGFATRGDVLLRGDFFRAENANAPIVVMLGGYDDDFSEFGSNGRLRRRLPVAAKIALFTAALTMAVGASPMPPGASAFLIKCVSTVGTSSIRIGR